MENQEVSFPESLPEGVSREPPGRAATYGRGRSARYPQATLSLPDFG